MNSGDSVVVSARIPAETLWLLELLVAKSGKSRSDLVASILAKALNGNADIEREAINSRYRVEILEAQRQLKKTLLLTADYVSLYRDAILAAPAEVGRECTGVSPDGPKMHTDIDWAINSLARSIKEINEATGYVDPVEIFAREAERPRPKSKESSK